MYAGSPTVICSLWRVDDSSTALLMDELYTAKAPGGKLRAFVRARQNLRKTYPQPFFWAPFVYVGDPR
jgi:CHAT domain-containing protein